MEFVARHALSNARVELSANSIFSEVTFVPARKDLDAIEDEAF
jgi:hypothetical protein